MIEYPKIPNIFKREEGKTNRLLEGEYSTPELQYLSHGTVWRLTEKVDGTNIRVLWDGYTVSFAGRTDRANIPEHLMAKLIELFGGPEKEELFEQTFGKKYVILFGEGFGEKIQKGGELYGSADFILFDVMIGQIDGYKMFLRYESVEQIASTFGIKCVPTVGLMQLTSAVEFVKGHPKSALRDAEMEGVVARPLVDLFSRNHERIIVKIKCRDFQKEEKHE